MNLREIKEELLRAAALVEDFEKNHLEIDRDAALNKIRQAYEELRFIDVILVDEPTTEPVAPFVSEEDDEPEIEVEFIMPEEDEEPEVEEAAEEPEQVVYVAEEEETETEVEVETEVIPEPEPIAEPEPEPITESEPIAEPEPIVEDEPEIEVVIEEDFDIDEAFEPELDESEVTPEPKLAEVVTEPEPEVEPVPKRIIVEQSLFGDFEPVVKKSTPARRKIMALYEDEPAVTPTPKVEPAVEPTLAPVAEPEPVVEPAPAPVVEPTAEPVVMPALEGENKVLGEVITPTTTIADTIAPVVSVAEDRPVETLRGAINVVDRFMLIRDLFDDDADLYEQTIDELEKMDNLDDCIIYIAENFAWRPSSEGAKLMMDLLQRKLG